MSWICHHRPTPGMGGPCPFPPPTEGRNGHALTSRNARVGVELCGGLGPVKGWWKKSTVSAQRPGSSRRRNRGSGEERKFRCCFEWWRRRRRCAGICGEKGVMGAYWMLGYVGIPGFPSISHVSSIATVATTPCLYSRRDEHFDAGTRY